MQTFKALISLLLTASLAVNAETTSCVTSTKNFPTITSIIVEPTSTWSGNGTCGGPHTVYTTEYHEFCSTGLRLHTYTITEACHKEKCQPRTTGVPPGFTSTVTVCNSCGERPITATLTVPCPEATATKGPGKPPVKPQAVPSAPAVKPVPTGPQPEECTTCGPKPTNPGEDKAEHPNSPVCTTCGGSGQPSQPPAQPNPPAACTTCGAGGEAPQPPASLATSVVPGLSGEKPGTSPTSPSPGAPSVITAGAAKSSYAELGLLGVFGFGMILFGVPL
ncbi:hypothetical protein FVER14953_01574 [Fusarium verticillioides]|nr:hypothetical protein FVER14953_01574 [Fusarium verticillioides]